MGLFQILAACALSVSPTPDYSYLVYSGISAPWTLARNSAPWLNGPPPQSFFQSAISQKSTYPRQDQLALDEGSLELILAAREDGSADTYRANHALFTYRAANGDYLSVTQSSTGILYLGGTVNGQWQSAYGSRGLMWGWRAGEPHHLLATWSASANRMKLYLDGVLTADSNEHHYYAPPATSATFTLDPSVFDIQTAILYRQPLDDAEIRAHATRTNAPQPGELWIPTASLQPGDTLDLASAACTLPLPWAGIPITDPSLPSTLLPPGTTDIDLTVHTSAPADCRYALNATPPFDDMLPLDGHVTGLSADPSTVDHVNIRCSHAPEFVLSLLYRSLALPTAPFPRKSNLWGSANMLAHGYDFASKVDLYLGAEMSPADIMALRARNPRMLILTSINTVENHNLPEDYYLHDTTGSKIEVWPGTYRLNLTKPYVAEYQARWAYRHMLDSGLLYDGCFFDNFFESQSWLKADIYGRQIQLDANEDGQPDDPAWLDAAWREGVYAELNLWRRLMPYAYASGHLPNPATPDLGAIFNGNSVLFWATHTLDGRSAFPNFKHVYDTWSTLGRAPALNTIEASPQNQIAYGYGYDLTKVMPASTLAFARDFYPYLRFPLAFTLLGDGYFHRDLGDMYHGNDWWYDEYDFALGDPLGPAELIQPAETAPDLLDNGNFELPFGSTWNLYVDTARSSAAATLTRSTDAAQGLFSARIDVTSTASNWQIDFHQRNRALTQGQSYDLSFYAKADTPRTLALAAQKGVPDWRGYGLNQSVQLSTSWQLYTVTFAANESVTDSRIQFFLGDQTGTVWLDAIELRQSPPQLFRRYFSQGAVLLNATRDRQTIPMPAGYARFTGSQAPLYQYIVDDTPANLTTTGPWQPASFDTGEWKAIGPYYHHWGSGCHTLDGQGSAEWDLHIPADGVYSLDLWWAAAPSQSQWAPDATYEILSDGHVLATFTLDQTQPGDQWHRLATLELKASSQPRLRLRGPASGTLVADAVLLSSEARFNDGSPAPSVTLEPMDGILLRKVD